MEVTRTLNGKLITKEELCALHMTNDTLNYLFTLARRRARQMAEQARAENTQGTPA